jgi:hypothetical protein
LKYFKSFLSSSQDIQNFRKMVSLYAMFRPIKKGPACSILLITYIVILI